MGIPKPLEFLARIFKRPGEQELRARGTLCVQRITEKSYHISPDQSIDALALNIDAKKLSKAFPGVNVVVEGDSEEIPHSMNFMFPDGTEYRYFSKSRTTEQVPLDSFYCSVDRFENSPLYKQSE